MIAIYYQNKWFESLEFKLVEILIKIDNISNDISDIINLIIKKII